MSKKLIFNFVFLILLAIAVGLLSALCLVLLEIGNPEIWLFLPILILTSIGFVIQAYITMKLKRHEGL